MTELPLVGSGFAVFVFSPRDDPIACLNKAMAFLMAVGVVECYNCQGKGHMAKQCTQPKRPRNAAWYKDTAMLAEAQEAGQMTYSFPNNAAFQTEDLVLMIQTVKISRMLSGSQGQIFNYWFCCYLRGLPHSENYLNDVEIKVLLVEIISILVTTLNKVERPYIQRDLQVGIRAVEKTLSSQILMSQKLEDFWCMPPPSEDANQKFLRSLPSTWSQVSLIMRTKPGVDSLIFDDLYNNLRVFEYDVKGSTVSSSSTQNVAFVSENTSSTNDVESYNLMPRNRLVLTKPKSSAIVVTRQGILLESADQGNQDSRRKVVDWTSHSEMNEVENLCFDGLLQFKLEHRGGEVGLLRWWWWLWRTVMRMAAGVWGGDDGDDNEGGVMVGCGGEAAGGGGGAWRRVDMGVG
ncbi:integrase, catalytic region, zinc finger, CCHC-type containing protein [Tanacetum coccineum]